MNRCCYLKYLSILFSAFFCFTTNAQLQQNKAKPWQIKGAIAAFSDKIPEVKAFGIERLEELRAMSTIKQHNAELLKLLVSNNDMAMPVESALKDQKLSKEILEEVIALTNSRDSSVQYFAISILETQKLSTETIENLAKQLQPNHHRLISSPLIKTLGAHKLPPEIINKLFAFLKPEYIVGSDQSAIYAALEKQNLPSALVDSLVKMIRSKRTFETHFEVNIGYILRNQILSSAVVAELITLLDSPNIDIVNRAASALSNRQLSPLIIKKLTDLLQQNPANSEGISSAISHQKLSPAAISEVLSLQENNFDVHEGVAQILKNQQLSQEIIIRILNVLKHGDTFTRNSAASILGSQKNLSPQILAQITNLFISNTILSEVLYDLNLANQKLPPSEVNRLVLLLDSPNTYYQHYVPEMLTNQELSEQAVNKLSLLLDPLQSYKEITRGILHALSNRRLDSSVINRIIGLLAVESNRAILREIETTLSTHQLDFNQISAILSFIYINPDNEVNLRYLAHSLGRGDEDIETLLLWVAEPGKNRPDASKLSLEERKEILEVFAKAWKAPNLPQKYKDDLANQIANVVKYVDPDRDESLLFLLKTHRNNLKDYTQFSLISNKIKEIENINWLSVFLKTSRNVLIIHLLFWALLIFVYPKERFKWIRPIFFWNDYVRKIAGLGYVHLLLTYVPFLRNILFVPFRSALIADARLESFNENSFFRDSNVMEAETGKVLSLIDELIALKGSVILRGESGLGKTMCLRNLARHNKNIVVFLTSEQCDKGVIEAIQCKIMGFAGDLNFLQSLVYMGAIQIYIDGLNEVGPQTRLIISDFLKNFGGVNCIVTTQPIDWVPPGNIKIYEILPLSPGQIGQFLDGRFRAFKTPEITKGAFKKLADDFIAASTDPGLPEGELRQNEKILTNPMDLTIVAQMLVKNKRPNLLDLQKEYFEIMSEDFQRIHPHIIGGFPLQKFSENVFQMRLNDIIPLPYEEYHSEIECMEDHKMVLSRQYQSSGEEKEEWFFRHDKIRDFFIVQTFLKNPVRQTEYLDDPRFRGVYFLLATYLSYEDARSLREELIQYAAETKDHSVSDEFIKLFKNRRSGAAEQDQIYQ